MKILVVDDESLIADLGAVLLNRDGHRAIAVYSVSEALEHVAVIQFDLALLGVMMPQMNGVEAGIRIRELSPRCQVLLWVERLPPDLIEFSKSKGHNFKHIPSPFKHEDLLNKIREFDHAETS